MPDLCHREPEFFEMMRECRDSARPAGRLRRALRRRAVQRVGDRGRRGGRQLGGAEGPRAPGREQRRLRGPPGPDRAGPRDPRRGARVRRHHPRASGRRRGRAPGASRAEPRGGRPPRDDHGPPEPGDGRRAGGRPGGAPGPDRRHELALRRAARRGRRRRRLRDGQRQQVPAGASRESPSSSAAGRRWTRWPGRRPAASIWTSTATTRPRSGTTRPSPRRSRCSTRCGRRSSSWRRRGWPVGSPATRRTPGCCGGAWRRSASRSWSPRAARSSILTTFRLLPGLAYDPLHDAMKRRGYVIYAGQGDIRTYAFRVSNMGTLTPRDMEGVVDAFRSSLAELAIGVRL